MARRRVAAKREVLPDPIYNDELVTRCVNKMMLSGKKSTAEGIFYGALDIIKKKMPNEDPIKVFHSAVENVKPLLEVKSRRVGGATYQVPLEVSHSRRIALSLRWMISSARDRGERGFTAQFAGELMDAHNKTGGAMKKRDETHKMAEANKAFSHYRWW